MSQSSEIMAVKPVTWDTFVRAETDKYSKSYVDIGGFGKFFHVRLPTPIDQQNIIRMNRDTLYSMGVFDLTNPVTIIKPDTANRFQSMQVINQDQYTRKVLYDPGEYTFTQENIGTRYVIVVIRTLVDATKPEDIKAVNEIQDKTQAQQSSTGTYEVPNWDQESQDRLRDAINVLAATMTDSSRCFGDVNEVDPVAFLLGSAFGFGGNPAKDATYLNVVPDKNDGKTAYTLTVKEVPVDAFWSISLYNKDGYYEKNDREVYVINDRNATKNEDGSITIHFGGDTDQPNNMPIMEGWNYIVRLYRPRKEILDGTWTFPAPQLVD